MSSLCMWKGVHLYVFAIQSFQRIVSALLTYFEERKREVYRYLCSALFCYLFQRCWNIEIHDGWCYNMTCKRCFPIKLKSTPILAYGKIDFKLSLFQIIHISGSLKNVPTLVAFIEDIRYRVYVIFFWYQDNEDSINFWSLPYLYVFTCRSLCLETCLYM